MLFWFAFKLAEYGSEQPLHRFEPVVQPLVLQPKLQALFSKAEEGVFQPGLADLFEAVVGRRSYGRDFAE